MGQIGTPIIAVESGYVEALGWNQYGGWRIGIRSFDKKRYYYYAHLRQNFPYALDLKEGSVVTAGDVIGYMGHTGYSAKENVKDVYKRQEYCVTGDDAVALAKKVGNRIATVTTTTLKAVSYTHLDRERLVIS